MSDTSTPSIFEAFNARTLEPNEVAHTFVPSQAFVSLVKKCHSIVVGPRGSGKTTLLKMLQQRALEAWNHPDADGVRHTLNFTGVFIPTDVSWGEQLKALGTDLDDKSRQLLSVATFTTHVLRSLIDAMLSRVDDLRHGNLVSFRRVLLSAENQISLAKMICEAWHLQRTVPSLLGIKQGLSLRLKTLREIASREVILGESGRRERLGEIPFLHLHFVQSAGYAAEVFDDYAKETGAKWGLLFDELELAPPWIQDELMLSLRSTDARFLFKLAMNPFSPSRLIEEGATRAAYKQDYDYIPLWYPGKQSVYPFCEALWHSMLRQKGYPQTDPKEALGRSYFETPQSEWIETGTAYGPTKPIARTFQSLSKTDPTFRDYLTAHKIDPLRMHRLSSTERAAHVRKVAPLVIVRQFFRTLEEEGDQERSRKRRWLYAGAESLFSISEGNPRWLIGILDRLLDEWNPAEGRIKVGRQAKAIERAAQAFTALLRTLPGTSASEPERGILELLRIIGIKFHTSVVREPFIDDPPLTIDVDRNVSESTLALVIGAVNSGALVYIPDKANELVIQSPQALRGKRFRLSFLLAPQFKLPLRLGRSIALTSILRPAGDGQKDLFQ